MHQKETGIMGSVVCKRERDNEPQRGESMRTD